MMLAACACGLGGCGAGNGEFKLLNEQPSGSYALASGVEGPGTVVRAPRSETELTAVGTPGSTAYKIGPADVLEISVFKVPELARTVLVDDAGIVILPLIGEVAVAGKTSRELERDLAKRLGGKYLQSPQVLVAIKEYNSQRVTIEGAIKTPGVHALKGRSTLMQLVAMSGGIDKETSDSIVVVFRNTDGQRYAAKFDFDAIRSGQAQDPVIMPGDVVVANTSALKSAWSDFLKALPVASFARLLL
jgi:polysaccharide export outer membrane protein